MTTSPFTRPVRPEDVTPGMALRVVEVKTSAAGALKESRTVYEGTVAEVRDEPDLVRMVSFEEGGAAYLEDYASTEVVELLAAPTPHETLAAAVRRSPEHIRAAADDLEREHWNMSAAELRALAEYLEATAA